MKRALSVKFARRLALAATAFAIASPLYANAAELRYFGHLGINSREAISTLSAATRFGTTGPKGDQILALVQDGQLIISAKDLMKLESFSPETLVKIVNSGACDLETVGPCFVNEKNVTLPIGVRTNSAGVSEVIEGTYKHKYVKRVVKFKGKRMTVKTTHLLPSWRFLNKVRKGQPTIYTTAISPYHVKEAQRALAILEGRDQATGTVTATGTSVPTTTSAGGLTSEVVNVPHVETVTAPNVGPGQGSQQCEQQSKQEVTEVVIQETGERVTALCGIEATLEGQSFHLGVGFTEGAGKGLITCKTLSGQIVAQLPIKVVTQGLGVGIGATFNSRTTIVASGVGLMTSGIRGFLGKYAVATAGGHAAVIGAEAGIGFTAKKDGIAIPFGVRGKTGVGLELSGDISGLVITEDDGTPAVLPPREPTPER